MKRKPVAILLALIPMFLFLLAAEMVLRVLDLPAAYRIPRPDEQSRHQLIHQKSKIPGLNYELKRTDAFPGRTNPLGLRDTLTAVKKPPHTRRVVCLGDSFTFGIGVELLETYAKRLEHYLSSHSTEWQTVNMGVGGYSSRDESLVFRYRVPQFDPDIVTIGYVLNDPAARPHHGMYNYFAEHPSWHRVHLFRLVHSAYQRIQIRRWGGHIRCWHCDPKHWRTVESAFRLMRATGEKLAVPVLLVIFPNVSKGPATSWDNYGHQGIHEKVAQEGRSNGFEILDLLPHFRQFDPQKLRVSEENSHPSPFAHDLAAKLIAERILLLFQDAP